ncbi:hypothetical protein QTP70_033496, partial [Hemibagrus guttatus]
MTGSVAVGSSGRVLMSTCRGPYGGSGSRQTATGARIPGSMGVNGLGGLHSCVNANDILDPTLLEEFHRIHPSRTAPCPRDCPQRRTPG